VSDVVQPLKDKVWFTFKARIVAHEMLVFKNNLTQLLLVWYSFLSVVSSIILIRHNSFFGKDGDIYLTGMSLFVLILSLIVSNRDYRGREKEMRINYLQLQALYREIELSQTSASCVDKLETWNARYQQILEAGENHRGYHDLCQRVRSAASLTSRKPSKTELVTYYLAYTGKSTAVILMFSLPVLLLLLLNFTK
jgi:hypothetical protein